MYYSGLLITSRPGQLSALEEALRAFPNVEIHQRDEAAERLILVMEANSVDDETDEFRKLRSLPPVADLSLIVHREDALDSETNN